MVKMIWVHPMLCYHTAASQHTAAACDLNIHKATNSFPASHLVTHSHMTRIRADNVSNYLIWCLSSEKVRATITLYNTASETIARVPKMARHAENFPWHAAFTSFPIVLFLLPGQLLHIVKNVCVCVCVCVCIYIYICVCVCVFVCVCIYVCVYTYISDCIETVYEVPLLPNNTAVKHFYTNRSGVKCWLDIYCWGAGVRVNGQIRDIGQNVLQYSL